MRVELIARPEFIGLPKELGQPAVGQLVGPDAQRLIETAGRACYDSFGKGRGSDAYAQHILEVGHGSVLEHAQYSFFITGVSRGLTHELVRHRVGVAISQRSTRYVDEDESPWAQHPLLEQYLQETSDNLDEDILGLEARARWVYDRVAAALQNWLIGRGADRSTARKQARGAARGYLGNALETELVWSANVRALRHVIALRGHPTADAEIRELAVELLEIMQRELPAYFEDFYASASKDGGVEVRRKSAGAALSDAEARALGAYLRVLRDAHRALKLGDGRTEGTYKQEDLTSALEKVGVPG